MLLLLDAIDNEDERSDDGLSLAPVSEQADDTPSTPVPLRDRRPEGLRKHAKLGRTLPELPDDIDAMSIPEFCRRHGLSQWMYFQLQQRGEGPRTMKVGGRVYISREAAAQWRRLRERDALREAQKKERRRVPDD
jgi:hypothetical protein